MSVEKIALTQRHFGPMYVNTTQTKPISQADNTEKNNKKVKTIALAGLGVIGTVALALLAIRRGKNIQAELPQPRLLNSEEMSVAGFKEIGYFNKGKAVLANGTDYTGKIISNNTKDGSMVVMEYKDGVLQKSTKTIGEEIIFEKNYKYSDEGDLVEVFENGTNVFRKFVDQYGNLHIKTRNNFLYIDKPTGLIRMNKKYIDKQSGYSGTVSYEGTLFNRKAPKSDEIVKIAGVDVPLDAMQTEMGSYLLGLASKGGESGALSLVRKVDIRKSGTKNNALFQDDIFVSNGKVSEYDSYPEMNSYRFSGQNLFYNHKTGVVSPSMNENIPLFKYYYKTGEISDLNIDKNEATEMVKAAKEARQFYKKLKMAELRYNATWQDAMRNGKITD